MLERWFAQAETGPFLFRYTERHMKRLVLAVTASALLLTLLPMAGNAVGRFENKLSKDRQVLHVLNRLTFGPRPGDAEEVRRAGVEKWIDLQLHPDRIPENPLLKPAALSLLKHYGWTPQPF